MRVVVCPDCRQAIPFENESPPDICPGCSRQLVLPIEETALVDAASDVLDTTQTSPNDTPPPAIPSSLPRPREEDPPKRFGDYELLHELARGGMGVVYRAYHVPLQRVVALKMIKAGDFASAADVKRFHTEAEAAANLDHPNIVPVYEVGEWDGRPYYTMGFIGGQSLGDVLKQGPMPQLQAADFSKTVCEAIAHAHAHGVVHRDLKPGNILIDTAGNLRVADFGLAKRVDGEGSLTSTGQVMGTPSYMPPEQAAGRVDEVNAGSDIYSIGAVLYCMLTGRPPFQAASPVETLRQVLECEPVAPRDLNSEIDRDLETICLKALEKSPANRYGSVSAMGDDLQRFLTGAPITARRVGRAERMWRWCRRNKAATTAFATATVAVTAIVGLAVATAYQQRLQEANDGLAESNSRLEDSLDRETELKNAQSRLRRQAESARDSEKTLKEQIDRIRYIRQVNLAVAMWEQNDVVRARALLKDCPERWRHWEWHYAFRVCHPLIQTFKGGHGDALDAERRWLAKLRRRPVAEDAQLAKTGHKLRVTVVIPDPMRQRMVSTGSDKRVIVWDLAARKKLFVLKGEVGGSRCQITFDHDGKRFATAGSDKILRIWSAATGREIVAMQGHSAEIRSLAFNHDGTWIASSSADKTTRVWDSQSGKQLVKFAGGGSKYSRRIQAFSRDGSRLAVSVSSQVHLIDAVSGKRISTLKGHSKSVNAIAFTPDGKRVVTAGQDATIRIWNPRSGNLIATLRGHAKSVTRVAFSPDGRQIGSANRDGTLQLRRVPKPAVVLATFSTGSGSLGQSRSVVSPTGKLAVSQVRNSLFVYDTAKPGRAVHTLPGQLVSWVAFSPNGKGMATTSLIGGVKIWDLTTGRELLALKSLKPGGAWCVAFSPDGKRLAVGGVGIWDTKTGQPVVKLTKHSGAVQSVAFSHDGEWLATGSLDAMLWDARTGQHLHTLSAHTRPIRRLAFSPDKKRIATAGDDGTVRVWDAAAGQETLTLRNEHIPSTSVDGLAFSKDGKQLAVTGAGGMHEWDARSRKW